MKFTISLQLTNGEARHYAEATFDPNFTSELLLIGTPTGDFIWPHDKIAQISVSYTR